MRDLNSVSSEYRPNGATEVENNLVLKWYPERIIRRFGHATSLLELGLGHGFTAEIFPTACDEYVVLDGSTVVIDQFRQKHPDFSGEVVETYFETYDTDKRFDVIVMGFVLEHVDDPDLLLQRYRRFMKPGGRMYIAVPNAKSMNRRLGLEMGLIDDIYSLNANDLALGHQRQYCRATLTAAVRKAGYTITHEEGIYLKPLPLHVLQTLPDMEKNMQGLLNVGIEFPDLCVALLMELQSR